MTNPIIKVKNLAIERQTKRILSAVSFQINAKEQLLLTGEAGCGKTSLGLALAGQLYAHGEITFNFSQESLFLPKVKFISQFYEFKNKSGLKEFYYQQRYNSYDSDDALSVKDVISNGGILNNAQEYLLSILSLEHRLEASLIQLSSGERKKLQLIIELANPAQIMIIDNPYIGLDAASIKKLNQYFSQLSVSGVTFIIISDDMDIPDFITIVGRITKNKGIELIPKEIYQPLGNSPDTIIEFEPSGLLNKHNYAYPHIIKFNQVNVVYGNKKALDDINWLVKPGEKWLLSGHNGAGKSTLLSLITADHPQAYANDFYLFGIKRGSGESIWDIKRNIGYVSPELHWNFSLNLTCLEAVLSGFFDTPGLYRHATEEQKNLALAWLNKLNLSEYVNDKFTNLSIGIQRMVLLVRAIVKDPLLLIFDEPCQGLDDMRTRQFTTLIDKLFANSEHTILYVSHRPDQSPKCLNHVLELNSGKVIRNSSLAD